MSTKATDSLEQFESSHRVTEGRSDPHHPHLVRDAAVLVAVLAALLAVASFLAESAMKHVLTGETRAADVSARRQANAVRTTVAENDVVLLRVIGAGSAAERRAATQAAEIERDLVSRYGPIDARLQREIAGEQHARDHAEEQHRLYELSSVALQIAIVLASISIIARSAWLLRGGGALGVGAIGLLLAGLLA
jgi:hypothetical protein